MRFVKAEEGPNDSVIYTSESGVQLIFSSGNRNWRNNNPGNLKSGKVSRRNGQLGVAGGFSVFPSPEAGRQALLDSLLNAHGDESLSQMIRIYAPKKENKTAKYLKFLRKRTGVNDDRKIKDLSPAQFESLWRAIQDMEGRNKPTVSEILKKRIVKVRKDKKGTITALLCRWDGLDFKSPGYQVGTSR